MLSTEGILRYGWKMLLPMQILSYNWFMLLTVDMVSNWMRLSWLLSIIKTKVRVTDTKIDILSSMQKLNSIIVFLYIFLKKSAKKDFSLWVNKSLRTIYWLTGFGSKANHELDLITQYLQHMWVSEAQKKIDQQCLNILCMCTKSFRFSFFFHFSFICFVLQNFFSWAF